MHIADADLTKKLKEQSKILCVKLDNVIGIVAQEFACNYNNIHFAKLYIHL